MSPASPIRMALSRYCMTRSSKRSSGPGSGRSGGSGRRLQALRVQHAGDLLDRGQSVAHLRERSFLEIDHPVAPGDRVGRLEVARHQQAPDLVVDRHDLERGDLAKVAQAVADRAVLDAVLDLYL